MRRSRQHPACHDRFGEAGIPVRSIMSHQSGLTGLAVPASVTDYMGMNLVDDPRKMAVVDGVYQSLAG
jgi:hypothetical protein